MWHFRTSHYKDFAQILLLLFANQGQGCSLGSSCSTVVECLPRQQEAMALNPVNECFSP